MATSFVVILFFGKRMPKKGAEVGIAAVGLCFLIALLSAGAWISRVNDASGGHTANEQVATAEEHGADEEAGRGRGRGRAPPVSPSSPSVTWFESAAVKFEVGTLVDGLSVMMLFVVTIISLLVHIYSTDYVGGDRRYTHYFAFLSPLHRVDAHARDEPQHGAVHHQLGAGRPLLVRAHRALVGGEAELRRRAQGVHHQPRRRRRPA